MSQTKIYVEPQTPRISLADTSYGSKNDIQNDDSSNNDSPRSAKLNENGVPNIPLDDLNNLLENSRKGIFPSNASFDASDDELSQLTNSNSVNDHGDRSNDSMSDSQLLHSSEKKNIAIKKFKKQKKKNRFSQMISDVSHKSKSDLFQKLFKDMAPDELLVSDYSCALQRDILVHGRLYLSQTWLCFYANIFGWETLVTIRWVEITAITKEKTAKLIPNAIQIFTDTDKFFFSTFVTREHAYTGLFRIWQNALLGQPMLPTDLKNICKKKTSSSRDAVDGIPINDDHDETGDEMIEFDDDKSFVSTSESVQTSGNGNGNKLENGDIDGLSVFSGVGNIPYPVSNTGNDNPHSDSVDNSANSNENGNGIVKPAITKLDTSIAVNNTLTPVEKDVTDSNQESKKNTPSPIKEVQLLNSHRRKNHKQKHKKSRNNYSSFHLKIPGREAGITTDEIDSEDDSVMVEDDDVLCPCHDTHKGKEYASEEFNFDVDALYEHLFSQESDMMKTVFKQRKFENTKYTPYTEEDDGSYLQILSYTIPLNYSIGPKQCNTVTKQIMQKDNKPGSFHIVKTESTTVGVPYGDSFYVNTQYCITRASGNRSRLRITTEIVYTKRVFGLVKNMISRGTDEAVKDYTNFLVNILKSESDLLSYKTVKPPKKKLTKTKSSESAKPIHCELPLRETSAVGQLKLHNIPDEQQNKEDTGLNVKKSSLRGFALMFCLLFLMNVYMLSRLRTLEKSVLVNKGDWLPKELPTTKEEWNNLLGYQKSLHELELYKLKEVIGNTASLLEQVQLSIKSLHDDIEKSIVDGRTNAGGKQFNPKDTGTTGYKENTPNTDSKDEL